MLPALIPKVVRQLPDFDPYELLGVPRDFQDDNTEHLDLLKIAVLRARKRWHPDRQDGKGDVEMMSRVNRAYDLLTDPELRARWDLAGFGAPDEDENTQMFNEQAFALVCDTFKAVLDDIADAEMELLDKYNAQSANTKRRGLKVERKPTIVECVKADINMKLQRAGKSLKHLQRKAETVRKLGVTVKHVGKRENMFARLQDDVLTDLLGAIAATKNSLEILKVAKRLVKPYKPSGIDPFEIPPDPEFLKEQAAAQAARRMSVPGFENPTYFYHR